jgi:hypothetical protein
VALFQINHVPESIRMNLPLDIVLPDPGRMGDSPVSQRKVLYLLRLERSTHRLAAHVAHRKHRQPVRQSWW